MKYEIARGDILDQPVEVIVNSWNRNIVPWWLLLPQGVSGTIKKHAGYRPFIEVGRLGPIPLGEARETSAGRLDFKAIIHVAGINMFWVATEKSVRDSVINAMEIVEDKNYRSVAFPLIGSGSGNRKKDWALQIMSDAFAAIESQARVIMVIYR